MDEKLIDDLYQRAVSMGYKKTRNDFMSLIKTDQEVFNDMFSYASGKGLTSDENQFGSMVGKFQAPYKKKDESGMVGLPEQIMQTKPQAPTGRGAQRLAAQQAPAMESPLAGGLSESQGVDERLLRGRRPEFVTESTAAPKGPTLTTGQVQAKDAERKALLPEFAIPLIETITPSLVGKEEQDVVPQLNYQFGDLGFKFEQSGMTGDYLRATAPNGQKIEISLDAFTSATETKEADKLRRFITENTINIPKDRLSTIEKQYKDENKKFLTEEEVKAENKKFADEQESIKNDITEFNKLRDQVNDQEVFMKMAGGFFKTDAEQAKYLQNKKLLQERQAEIQGKIADYSSREAKLNRSLGKYYDMKGEQGTWYDAAIAAPIVSVGAIVSGITGLSLDLINEFAPEDWIRSAEWWKQSYAELAEKDKVGGPDKDANGNVTKESYDKWWSSLSSDYKSELESRVRDRIKKEDKGVVLNEIRKAPFEVVAPTEEYIKEAKKSWLGAATLGALESIPAFFGGGTILKTAKLIGQTDDALMQEMENDPDFKDVSENEKRLITLPVSIVVSELEKFGFRNIISNKGLLNKLAMSAIGKAGATTTAKTFGELVRNEVQSGLARGVLTLVGGALAEAETGAAQQAAEYTVKGVYNAIKGKEMFNLPTTVGEYALEILNAGAMEAVGGLLLGAPSAVAAASRAQGYLGISDDTFKLFEEGASDANIQTAYVNSLKNKVSSGEMTSAEAKAQLNEYRNAVSLLRSVPTDLSTEDKKKAMNLLRERRGLENQIQGKDAALVKPQQDRINTINQELTKLSEDAVQKQAAGQVPVQPTTGVSQQMAEGEPQAEPQVAAEEGITAPLTQEEVTRKNDLQEALENPDKEKGTVTIGESVINIGDAQKELDAITQKEVSLKTQGVPVVKAQVQMVKFPTATTTLETEGTGVITEGVEPVFKGNNAPTVNLSTDTGERYAEDYTADEIEVSEHAPNSRVVSVAANLGSGEVSYTKKGEKKTFSLPFINQQATAKIKELRDKYRAVKGTSKSAKEEKVKLKSEVNSESKKVLADFKNTMVQNLLALYDSLTPEFIAKSKQWYVGANRMAQALAQKYNISIDQVGGIIAALSPQNDWFNNVSVAERAIEVMTKYADTKLTKSIVDKAVAYNTDNSGERNSFAQDILDLFNQYGEVSINELQSQGLSPESQSAILRAFDQALHSPKVAMTDPEGKFVGFDKTPVRWNSNTEIAKAISIFRNGSIENINAELGGGNKVRNFYNNIVDPDSETPYLTADTHALSAALNSPISANDAGGIGLFNGGAEPLYALVKAAYIDAARIAGIKPREMQSITWEAQRIGINDKSRTEDKKNETFKYITESRTNNQTPYERATELIARNRSANPSWGAAAGIETQKSSDAIREGAKLRAEQRVSDISSLRGPSGERVGAATTAVGGAVTGGPGLAETVKEQLGVPSSDTAGISAIESRSQEDVRKKGVVEAVKKAVQTFKSLFPDADIYIHETPQSFLNFGSKYGWTSRTRGSFLFTKNADGTYKARIDINLSSANATTVYHEVAHAVMLKAFGENKQLFESFRDKMSSVLADSTVSSLNQFADLYSKEQSPEEWLVELAARMSSQEKQIPQSLIDKIAAIVNKIVSDITNGAFKPFSETASKKEVIDFFNEMSASIRQGEQIKVKGIKIEGPAKIGVTEKVSRQEGVPVSELPGYDKLLKDVTDTLIPNAIKRKLTGQEMIDLVKRFVSKQDIYKVADDIQRDELVRQVNGMLGEAYRNPPSAQKLLGLIQNPTRVTMNEKTAFKKQIMDIARGAKDAKKAWMKATDELTKSIKDMVRGRKISIKQATAVLRRFSGVNMFSEDSISKFVDYMSKVFADAEYADRIATIRKSLKQAKKNIESKIGISAELKPMLRQMLAINPNLIPDSVLDTYAELVQMFGERKAVLSLQDVRDVTRNTSQVLEAIRQQESLVFELKERFEQFDQKVLDDDGKVMFSDTVTAMVDLGLITSAEADVMKKYKSEIFPKEGEAPKTEAELRQEKDSLISSIVDAEVDPSTLPSRDERDAALKLSKLINDPDVLDTLSVNDLQNLYRVIDLINNGYFPHIAEVMVEKLEAAKKSEPVLDSLKTAKPLSLSQFVAKVKNLIAGGKRGVAATMIERLPMFYLDQVFGDFKSSALYNNIIKPISVAQAKFKKDYNDIQNKLNRAFAKVSSSFNDNPNKVTKSKFKMMTYLLELEYRSNPGSKSVASAMSFINKTVKAIQGGNTQYSDLDAEMLQDIASEFADGTGNEIDIDSLYDSFNESEKSAIKTIQDINKSLSDKAAYTANVIRGQKFVPVENYIHHSVIFTGAPMDDLANTSLIQAYNNSVTGSTRAKSLIERTDGAKPIDFDVESVVGYSAKGQLIDYYLTAPIRTARRTMNLVEKEMSSYPSEKRKLFQGVNKSFERAVDNFLIDTIAESTLFDKFTELVSRQGYRAVLASVPRFISELTSNFSYVLAAGKKDFAAGVGIRDIVMSAAASSIMRNLGSQQTNRVYSGDTLSGNMIDPSIMRQTMGTKGSKVKGDLANATAQIYNKLIKKPVKNPIEVVADTLISTPDKLIIRPLWFGAFRNEFKKITGSEPDFKKIEANDEAYMNENKEALDQATTKADQTSVFAGATDNPFMGILKGTTTRDSTVTAKIYNNFNNFMTRFLIYEYMTARTAVYALAGNGQITKQQATGLLAGVTSRMVVYSLLTNVLGNAMLGAVLGDDDEEDEKSFGQKVAQATTSAFTSMFIGRDFGNVVKSIANIGVEKINENYLEFLRNGDYDPYKDAIQYTVTPTGEQSKPTELGNLIANLSGSFGPALKTANIIVKKMTEPEKKEEEARRRTEQEIGVRIPLEVLGNLGFVPLYKDIRKIVLADMYKDMGKKSSASQIKESAEKYLLQGYDNRSDMKRYDPDLYEKTFGEGGLADEMLPEDEIKKQMKEEQKRIERAEKDAMYDYIPNQQRKKNMFGGSKFGGSTKGKGSFGGSSKGKSGFGSKKFGE